jgi:ribosomal protein S27E
MKFTAITCPQCGYEQSIGIPERGVKALHKCDNCKVVLSSPNPEINCIICAYGTEDCPGRALGHPSHQGIRWNKVTWYSKIVAVILFVLVYMVGFWLGTEYQITANDIISMQTERQAVALSMSHSKARRVLGVTTENRKAVYWINVSEPNPHIEDCSGAPIPVYLDEELSLEEIIDLQLSEERTIDRLTAHTNPLAKTDFEVDVVAENEDGKVVALTGSIDDLSFCEQIQVISQLQAIIKQEHLDVPVEVTLNNATLFIVPAESSL